MDCPHGLGGLGNRVERVDDDFITGKAIGRESRVVNSEPGDHFITMQSCDDLLGSDFFDEIRNRVRRPMREEYLPIA